MARVLYTLLALFLLFLFWLFRPGLTPPDVSVPEELPELTFQVDQVDREIQRREERAGRLRPGNEARVVWYEPLRGQTAQCAVLYIHGFTASYMEGYPLHEQTAEALGCHLYVARLHGHGMDTDAPLADMQPDSLLADAVHALAVANLLGEEVAVIGTSMGGMIALHLASRHPESADALVLLSPLIEFAGWSSFLFDKPWGQRIMKLILGGSYIESVPESDEHEMYWYTRYRKEALMALKTMRNSLLTEDVYGHITQPVFAGYYYRDEDHQDDVVSVSAIRGIEEKLGTPPEHRRFVAFPDADSHVLSSKYRTDSYGAVTDSVVGFLKQYIGHRADDQMP
ncbi:alpha/beta hydrolase [Balneolales bacterium ANBcel1]|nr:alpha/beta hydrolase [Balneolales bacterium ANBcel1]